MLALLPPGRAYQLNDGGPWPGSVLYRFFDAVASMRAWFNQRICDMRREFFCATASETLDVWNAQYGLPDDCDPYVDLCVKVAAIGSQRCEWFKLVAQRHGWTIACVEFEGFCGSQFGCARFGGGVPATTDNRPRFGRQRYAQRSGCAPEYVASGHCFGAQDVNQILIVVYLNSSASYVAPTVTPLLMGRGRFGQHMTCAVDSIAPIKCVIERITPAHAIIVYRTQ